MQGQILGNRYELIEKIGGGGMAIVYKARCKMLNRFVAVKILRPEYTNDEEFVKRFLVEAQSAASLSHPNIVSIYDVGHEENLHYIVMEFINGVTLKDYIVKKGSLPWRESVNIAIQICSAIEHAHRNHIVHRDIKPHNILLTEEGIAKVTDFGIARAVSSSTITMVGSTIGSVHYFSPEQARGGYIGERSDIYSLGIALYEMVTGRIPFDGETPVAVALKHIQEEPVPPRDINQDIPKALNDIIIKATKKEQDQRYQTATDMLQDMYRVGKEPDGNFVREEVNSSSPTRRVKTISEENLVEKDGTLMKGKQTDKRKKSDKKTIWLAVGTCAAIILAFAVMMIFVFSPIGNKKKSVEVKNYVGRNINEVSKELEAEGITAKIAGRKNSDEYEKDEIMHQSIDEGKTLKPGGYIDFDVSDGPKQVKVPEVVKDSFREASRKLIDEGLQVKEEEEFHETIPQDCVTRTVPQGGTTVNENTVITVYKSKGPEIKEKKVPNLLGRTRDEAMNMITSAGFSVGKILPEGNSIVTGKVISQDPPADSMAKEGSSVNLVFESPTPSPSPTPTPGGQRVMQSYEIELKNPQKYKDTIKVRVEATPSDTNKMELIYEETRNKSEFPLSVLVPIPNNGKTRVRVYLDNVSYATENLP